MEHWKNFSLENLSETENGILYLEEWLPIDGVEDYYHGSSFGRIKSLAKEWMSGDKNTPRQKEETILKQWFNDKSQQYLKCDLHVNGIRKCSSVHRIIGALFCPNPNNYKEINHLNSIPYDNRARNLEWTTRQDNIKYSFENGRRKSMYGVNNMNAVVNEELVRAIRAEYAEGKQTHRGLADKYKLGHTTVRQIVTGKTWKHVTN